MGTRLSEETQLRPKPMVEIGGIPILLHIMRFYYSHGFNDFVICAGYRAWDIKDYFLNYQFNHHHLEIDHRDNALNLANPWGGTQSQERWRVRVVDTGLNTQTGGRVARALKETAILKTAETFALTYGDGLSDVDLESELSFHRKNNTIGTVLGVRPRARFGEIKLNGTRAEAFVEKPQSTQGWINGGFFFFNKKFSEYLSTDESCILEREPLSQLAADGQLHVYQHEGFWQPMDFLRDKNELQSLWDSGKAPWKPVRS
jgi:glucose-1-phosphate cytidylyltransferase